MRSLLKWLGFGQKSANETYLPVYTAIVRQARQPQLYGQGMAPDSFDGRFDMMVVHVYLVLRRLKQDGLGREEAGQAIFDLFFRDMDQAMREMGVGDLGVGKKVKKMAEAFYGRVHAYDQSIEDENSKALQETLARNFYPDAPATLNKDMSAYVQALKTHLAGLESQQVLSRDLFQGFQWGDKT